MQQKNKFLFLCAAALAVVIFSCSKYKDPPSTGIDDRLKDKYCNDSRAVNYNWGFPGIPDNTVCIYPVDSFIGTWLFTDSMFLPNGDNVGVQLKTLTFSSTEDKALTNMAVTGWCNNASPFYVTANKYSVATVDTSAGGMLGQFLCNNSDTLTGQIMFSLDSALKGTMLIDFTIANAGGSTNHRGRAVKQ